jgi:hypothetical protein
VLPSIVSPTAAMVNVADAGGGVVVELGVVLEVLDFPTLAWVPVVAGAEVVLPADV